MDGRHDLPRSACGVPDCAPRAARFALLNGQDPVFFRPPSEPVTKYPEKLLADETMRCSDDHVVVELLRNLDHDLATVWRAMRRFCLLVNLGTQTHRVIYPDFIHETMTAVIYRLLHMDFVAGSINEIVRVGLLAFSHHVFLQWQDIKLTCYPFPTTYRDGILVDCRRLLEPVNPRLMLWLLMTGAISLFDVSEEAWLSESLREHVDQSQVKTWKEMKEVLGSFMWIAILDDQPGKQIYDQLFSN